MAGNWRVWHAPLGACFTSMFRGRVKSRGWLGIPCLKSETYLIRHSTLTGIMSTMRQFTGTMAGWVNSVTLFRTSCSYNFPRTVQGLYSRLGLQVVFLFSAVKTIKKEMLDLGFSTSSCSEGFEWCVSILTPRHATQRHAVRLHWACHARPIGLISYVFPVKKTLLQFTASKQKARIHWFIVASQENQSRDPKLGWRVFPARSNWCLFTFTFRERLQSAPDSCIPYPLLETNAWVCQYTYRE